MCKRFNVVTVYKWDVDDGRAVRLGIRIQLICVVVNMPEAVLVFGLEFKMNITSADSIFFLFFSRPETPIFSGSVGFDLMRICL